MKTAMRLIECTSRDGVTIGLVDALISIANVLTERLEAEAKRMKRSSVEFSQEVQDALTDLRHHAALTGLIYHHDERGPA